MTYFTYKDCYPRMYFIEEFTFNDKESALYVNKKVLNVPVENYTNAKLAIVHVIAEGANYIHEDVLCNPYVASSDFDVVYASIQTFLEQKESC